MKKVEIVRKEIVATDLQEVATIIYRIYYEGDYLCSIGAWNEYDCKLLKQGKWFLRTAFCFNRYVGVRLEDFGVVADAISSAIEKLREEVNSRNLQVVEYQCG